MKFIIKARTEYDEAWQKILEDYKTLSELRDFLQNLVKMLEVSESELTEAFAQLVQTSKSLIDPVVKILVNMLESKAPEERDEQKKKMLETWHKKENILGHVIGKLTFAQLEDEIISQQLLLDPMTMLMIDLNNEFYMKAKLTSETEELQEMADILASVFYHKPKINQKE